MLDRDVLLFENLHFARFNAIGAHIELPLELLQLGEIHRLFDERRRLAHALACRTEVTRAKRRQHHSDPVVEKALFVAVLVVRRGKLAEELLPRFCPGRK